METEFSFGQWIRRRRKILGLTQEALAEQVGYSAAMMRKIENNERNPSPRGMILLAEALEIPQDQQDAFLKVARQERAADRLGPVDQEEPFPWQASSQPKTNLPLPATLFVGREAELARLGDLLQDPACRLVTLVGLAGVGKTRLALQAARSQLDRFAHGVFFVSLAPLDNPQIIIATIANAIGYQLHGTAGPEEQLLRYLREKHMLLLLDNFEHLMEGVSLVPLILQAAPGIQLLVTSRERLSLQGEWVFEVKGLTYPGGHEESSFERAETYEGVQLFLQGALRANPGFSLNEGNRAWVVRICQMMEGLPLGIELAAAWVRALSCQEIAREIDKNLDFLKASARDIPERHQSLRSALDHSWHLLSPREKEAFRKLSVFRGGFRREAAQEVAQASLEVIASLLDKSMLKRVGEERYDLHELVRQYGAAHLQSDAQEYSLTQDRHSSYYAILIEQWEKEIASPDHINTLAEITAEMDNVRLAWNWMVARRQIANIQRSLHSLWRIHAIRGWLQEGAALMEQAKEALQTLDEMEAEPQGVYPAVLGRVLSQQGYFCAQLCRFEEAGELLQQSLKFLRSCSDRAALADTLAVLGQLNYQVGEFTEASRYIQESLALSRALGNRDGVVFCLIILSYIYLAQGIYHKAYEVSSEGLAICREVTGDPLATAYCLINLSTAAGHMGEFAKAERWRWEGLEISKTLNDPWSIGQTLRHLGLISFELGETGRAEAMLRQSVSQFREKGDRMYMAMALVDLGVVRRVSGALSVSKQYFREALQVALESNTIAVTLQALIEIAGIETIEGNTELALELVIHILQHPSTHPEGKDRAKQLREELVARLSQQQTHDVQARIGAKALECLVREILSAD